MSQEVQPTKRTRIRRSPEMIAELIWEAEKRNNTAEVCRRENIAPTLFYRWKQKFKEAGIQGLKALKRGPKTRDFEKENMARDNARLAEALCEASIELQLLKKSVSSGWLGRS